MFSLEKIFYFLRFYSLNWEGEGEVKINELLDKKYQKD